MTQLAPRTLQRTLDCRGMRCPEPILRLAREATKVGAEPAVVTVTADDDAFPKDLDAWCRAAHARVGALTHEGGAHRATILLNGATLAASSPRKPRHHPTSPPIMPAAGPQTPDARASAGAAQPPRAPAVLRETLDLRGMQCPEPIMRLARKTRAVGDKPAVLQVRADDDAFPMDVRSWVEASRSAKLIKLEQSGAGHIALIALNGGDADASGHATASTAPAPPPAAPAPASATRPASATAPAPPTQVVELDLCGMKCPEPIMRLAKKTRALGETPTMLHARADDDAFPMDVRSWVGASRGAELVEIRRDGDAHLAVIALHGAKPASTTSTPEPAALDTASACEIPSACELPASYADAASCEVPSTCELPLGYGTAPAPVPAAQGSQATRPKTVELDLRGMQCPEPIMRLARKTRDLGEAPHVLRITADDGAFPMDLRSWVESTHGAELAHLHDGGGMFTALIALHGAAVPPDLLVAQPAPPFAARPTPLAAPGATGAPLTSAAPSSQTAAPLPSACEVPLGWGEPSPPPPVATGKPAALVAQLDLSGRAPGADMAALSQAHGALAEAGGVLEIRGLAPTLRDDLMMWTRLVRAELGEVRAQRDGLAARVAVPGPDGVLPSLEVGPAPVVPSQPGTALVASEAIEPGVEITNQVTLLVLHNDLDAALAAMLVATGAASQGMKVKIFFSFWGVNILRASRARRRAAGVKGPGLLQRMMRWMMPKGPKKLALSKMHMAGLGTGVLKHIMRDKGIMSLEDMLGACVDLGVGFMVCTMSMDLMGIAREDLVDLPNLEFSGVAAFVGEARRSSAQMVF